MLAIGAARPTELARLVRTRDVTGIKSRVGTLGFKRFLARFQEGKISITQRSSDPSVAQPASQAALQPSTPEPMRSGRWSPDELFRLAEALHTHGDDAPRELLAKCVRTRTRTQIYDKLKEPGVLSELARLEPVDSTSAPAYGRWTETETASLEEAVSKLGHTTGHREIAAHIGTRTPAQVADKLKEAVKADSLTATGRSSFAIKR